MKSKTKLKQLRKLAFEYLLLIIYLDLISLFIGSFFNNLYMFYVTKLSLLPIVLICIFILIIQFKLTNDL